MAAAGQMLAFEPPDLARCSAGRRARRPWAACWRRNLVGPAPHPGRRGARPLPGLRGVNGRGEMFKAGGKVVKNVTGYDLSKLMAGSWGTLAVLDRGDDQGAAGAATRRSRCCCFGLADGRAVKAMAPAMGSPFEVSGAAHLPKTRHGACVVRDGGARRSARSAPAARAMLAGADRASADGGARHARTAASSGATSARSTPFAGDTRAAVADLLPAGRAPGIVARIGAAPRPTRSTTGRAAWSGWPCRRATTPARIVRGAAVHGRPCHAGPRRREGRPACRYSSRSRRRWRRSPRG